MRALHEALTEGFYRLAGPIAILAFCFWLAHYRGLLAGLWSSSRRRLLVLGGLSFSAAALVYASVPVGFKVLSDETNLLSVANMLSQFGKASNTQMWLYYYHEYHPLNWAVPTRPVLFPALTALVQSVIGLSWKAPFIVNFAFYVALFGAVLHWAGGISSSIFFVFCAGLSLLMNPSLSVMSASGGFDLVSLFFAFAAFLALKRYLGAKDEVSLRALLLAALCFASVRYESILVFPVLVAGLLWYEGEDVLRRVSWSTWSGLFVLMTPLIVQRGITWGAFENPPGVAPFSPYHFARHAPIFLRAFFLDVAGPFPVLLHWLGLAGILSWLRRPKSREERALGAMLGGYLALQILLLLSHHFGVADHPTQTRLFVPISFALTLLGFVPLARIFRDAGAAVLVSALLLLFMHHHRVAVRDALSSTLTMTREVRFLRDFGAGTPRIGRGEELFVYERPGQLASLGESAVSVPYFLQKKSDFELNLRRKLYQRVLFVERVPLTPKPDAKPDELPPRKAVFERQLSDDEKLVVSAWDPPR